jgi:hypothetical protein
VLVAILAAWPRIVKGGTATLSCTANRGECISDKTCKIGQIALLSDQAAGCEKGQICCRDLFTDEQPASPECKSKAIGAQCDDKGLMYCDAALQCVTKCEFCAKNFGTEFGRSTCAKDVKYFQNHSKDIHTYTCGCSAANCTTTKINNGTCLPKYCPAPSANSADSNYMCCVK